MLVESHDPGVVGWVDEGVVESGREVGVGEVVGWMWEDEDAKRDGERSQAEVHSAVLRAAAASEADGSSNGEQVSEVAGMSLRVKPFVWQAYVAEGERQEGDCAPSRKD